MRRRAGLCEVLLLSLALSGCFSDGPNPEDDPPDDPVEPLVLLAALAEGEKIARAQVSELSDNARLVFVTGFEWPQFKIEYSNASDDPRNISVEFIPLQGVTETWRFGYYLPDAEQVITLQADLNDGLSVQVKKGMLGSNGSAYRTDFGATYPDLDLRPFINAGQPVRVAESLHTQEFIDGTLNRVRFMLSAVQGEPEWVFAWDRSDNWFEVTTNTTRIDARTEQVIPEPYESLYLSFAEARPLAEPAAREWQPDAFLLAAWTTEYHGGEFVPNVQWPHEIESQALLGLDSTPGDGKAPAWLLWYRSPETWTVKTFVVYGSGRVVAGPAQPERTYIPEGGSEPVSLYPTGIPENVVDSPEAVHAAFKNYDDHRDVGRLEYDIHPSENKTEWTFTRWSGDVGRVQQVNATVDG